MREGVAVLAAQRERARIPEFLPARQLAELNDALSAWKPSYASFL
jgi:hypothetical protein